jgi:methylase of polypeptide subunit release factors
VTWYKPYVSEFGGSHPPSVFAETLARTMPSFAGSFTHRRSAGRGSANRSNSSVEQDGTKLLDIGCGSGIIGIFCLVERGFQSVTFNDVQPELVRAAQQNVAMRALEGRFQLTQVAYTEAVSFKVIPQQIVANHNLIAFNFPQLPLELLNQGEASTLGTDRTNAIFRDGGPDGLRIARDFFLWYANLQQPKPDVVSVLSSFIGESRINQAFAECGLRWKILVRTRVKLRPFFSEAAARCWRSEADRMDRSLGRGVKGDWTKDLLTVRFSS